MCPLKYNDNFAAVEFEHKVEAVVNFTLSRECNLLFHQGVDPLLWVEDVK